jgi:hypothetical protein
MMMHTTHEPRNQPMDTPHMDARQTDARQTDARAAGTRRAWTVIGAFIGAVAIAGSAVTVDVAARASGPAMEAVQAERPATALRASTPVPDSRTVSREARKSYADFWKSLPRDKADAFERELEGLESRARRGDDVSRDVERLRGEQSQFFELSTSLQSAKWMVTAGGGTQQATCTGLGWIGRNGRLRCLGRLST